MRSISEITDSIDAAKAADSTLSGLDSTSATAIWRLWRYITAVCMQVMEGKFDAFKVDVMATIRAEKPHTLQWYGTMARAYQYGDSLPDGSDVYDPVAPAGDSRLVVTQAVAVELGNLIRLKVATVSGSALVPLSSLEETGLRAYMGRVKDSGVRIQVTTGWADNLQLKVNVYYDALVLDSTGARLDGSAATPVMDAVNAFIGNLPFNGVMRLNALVAAAEAVEGVKIFEVLVAQANYASTPYINIITATPNVYVPDAGYMALDAGYWAAEVTYVAL